MASLYEAFSQGRARGAERARQTSLAELMGPAAQGDADAQAKLFGIDPQSAIQAGNYADGRRKDLEERHGRYAAAFAQTKDPLVYSQLLQTSKALYPQAANMPESLDNPGDLDGALRFAQAQAQAYGGGVKQPEDFTLAPGSARYRADGTPIVSQPFAPQGFKGQWDSSRAMWIPEPGTSYGGPTSNPITGTDFGIGETNDYVRKILGKVQVDPMASPEQQAEALLPHLIQQESGGNPNAISPKGAQGLTQVMPSTGRDPGFGVTPVRDGSPQENVRFGRDYLTAMLRRYPGRPDLALAAYNAGPGVADRFAGGQASNGGLAGIPVAGISPKADQPNVPSGYKLAADGRSLEPIPGGPADRKANPTAGDQAQGEMAMRKELRDRVKQDQSVVSMFRNVENAAANNSAAGDLSLIFAYMKMLDPGSVVREQEFANAQNAAGIPERILAYRNNILRGERMTDAQRKDFLNQARLLAAEAGNRITAATREQQNTADEYGYDARRATGMADFRGTQGGANESQGPRRDAPQSNSVKTIVRTGTSGGRKVVQYSDGSVAYAD